MPKKQLKVQPAQKVYKPKYPSYKDKNPLQYPETRPYPFSYKFINWVSTGGLASIMLFGGSSCKGLFPYNPFPLENAGVPYRPVMFGTGMPNRISTKDAVMVIRTAFEDAGIQLKDKVLFSDGKLEVYLDGYSEKDKMGFLLLDYARMDHTFMQGRFGEPRGDDYQDYIVDLSISRGEYIQTRREAFQDFIKDKEEYIRYKTKYNDSKEVLEYVNKLKKLPPIENSEERFNQYYLKYGFAEFRSKDKSPVPWINDLLNYVESRFEDSMEKLTLLHETGYRVKKFDSYPTEIQLKIVEVFNEIKKIKSDPEFIKSYLILNHFVPFNNNLRKLDTDYKYQVLKLEIMDSSPVNEWFNNIDKLNDYHDRFKVSLAEFIQLDENNKNGRHLIAPISIKDDRMIIDETNLREQRAKLTREEYKKLSKELREKSKMETLLRLEAEVKMYIKWAKSQMGG